MIKIEFASLKATIAALHGEGESPAALLGRFKYFQRLSWPGKSNVGRGSRAGYDVDQILALAVAFEVQETGATPIRVVRTLRPAWPAASVALAVTWAGLKANKPRRLFLVQSPCTFAELGREMGPETPAPDVARVIDAGALSAWLARPTGWSAAGLYLIDLDRLITDVAHALLKTAALDEDDLEMGFIEMGEQLFGDPDPATWTLTLENASAGS